MSEMIAYLKCFGPGSAEARLVATASAYIPPPIRMQPRVGDRDSGARPPLHSRAGAMGRRLGQGA